MEGQAFCGQAPRGDAAPHAGMHSGAQSLRPRKRGLLAQLAGNGEGERLLSLHPSWEGAQGVRHMGQPRLVSSWGFMDCVKAVPPLLH